MPNLIWLATGGIQGLTVERCQMLKNRNVILFPDLGAFEKWSLKANEIEKHCHCIITVSAVLENTSNTDAKNQCLDIADYLNGQFHGC